MWMVDSGILIAWMRKGESPTLLLEPFLRTHRLVSCGIIRAEVLRGIVNPEAKAEISALFDVMPHVVLSSKLWGEIAETAWALDRKGTVLPLTDIGIGVCALNASAEVVTVDAHFERIPGLKIRRDLPGINTLSIGH